MKGFPNQISSFRKIGRALKEYATLCAQGVEPDDGIFGESLIRAKVRGTGHGNSNMSPDEYLEEQRKKSPSDQSHRTTARGLKEFFRILYLISEDQVFDKHLTPNGQRVMAMSRDLEFDDEELESNEKDVWRNIVMDMTHGGRGDYANISHPYQCLLRLVALNPGITRAKCALALEAKNDSYEELVRISDLAKLDEPQILETIGVTQTNWDNAKKILPSFAEQLGDVRKEKMQQFYISDEHAIPQEWTKRTVSESRQNKIASGRTPRRVSPEGIAKERSIDNFQENYGSQEILRDDKQRLLITLQRFKRHNEIVRRIASYLNDAILYENNFDCFARCSTANFLIEAKSLNGTPHDEQIRVREALAQLLYYEAFIIGDLSERTPIIKIACFESRISQEHVSWLENQDIHTFWFSNEKLICANESRAGEWLAIFTA